MKRIVLLVVRVLLVLLSVSTAGVKFAQMPDEMALFQKMGFPDWLTIAFGVLQLVAGLALIPKKTRKPAAAVLALTFVVATAALFISSVYPFAPLSILFIVAALSQLVPHDS